MMFIMIGSFILLVLLVILGVYLKKKYVKEKVKDKIQIDIINLELSS